MSKRILCLDFDGVIHSYDSGWKGADVIEDDPVPGAMEFIYNAIDHFEVHIYSSRSGQEGGIEAMRHYINLHMTAYLLDAYLSTKALATTRDIMAQIKFPMEKPPAFFGIDDRVMMFKGTFPKIEYIKNFKPWNKKEV